jgi:hypothetical protein
MVLRIPFNIWLIIKGFTQNHNENYDETLNIIIELKICLIVFTKCCTTCFGRWITKLHSLIGMTSYICTRHIHKGFVDPKDARKVYNL